MSVRIAAPWVEAPDYLRDFNGLRRSLPVPGGEYGVFRERYPTCGAYWSVRFRPSGTTEENRGGCWEVPLLNPASMKEAVEWVEAWVQKHNGDGAKVAA